MKANIDGGKYGSTGCASLEHHTESGAVLPTTAIDVENMYTAGEAAVFGWNNPVVESKESAALLYRAVEESANVAPATADTDMRSTSGKNGEADDGSSGQEIDGGEGGTVSSCSLGAISHPLAACLFGYFTNKLVTEVGC